PGSPETTQERRPPSRATCAAADAAGASSVCRGGRVVPSLPSDSCSRTSGGATSAATLPKRIIQHNRCNRRAQRYFANDRRRRQTPRYNKAEVLSESPHESIIPDIIGQFPPSITQSVGGNPRHPQRKLAHPRPRPRPIHPKHRRSILPPRLPPRPRRPD